MESDKQHFRHILLFYYKKGKNAVQARKKLTDVYGEGVLTVRQCQNWFAKFRSGNFDVEDAPRSGRPVEADKDAIKALVDANQRNLCRRIDVCDSLLKRHENDPFLKRIITGDEKGHGAKTMNRLKPFPKPIFTKKKVAQSSSLLPLVQGCQTQRLTWIKQTRCRVSSKSVIKVTSERNFGEPAEDSQRVFDKPLKNLLNGFFLLIRGLRLLKEPSYTRIRAVIKLDAKQSQVKVVQGLQVTPKVVSRQCNQLEANGTITKNPG
ncbi:HTH_48 domain-containing protein [Trichonephila clavipes]|nr:HTH_48 domain-containing protein [Trichonephila clavipes]